MSFYNITGMNDIQGMLKRASTQLGAVYKSRRFQTEVDEGSEVNNVLYRSFYDSAYLKFVKRHEFFSR